VFGRIPRLDPSITARGSLQGRPEHPVVSSGGSTCPADRLADAGTSAAGTSMTTTGTRSLSTGARTSRGRSIAPPRTRADGRDPQTAVRLRARDSYRLRGRAPSSIAPRAEPAQRPSWRMRSSAPALGPMRDIVATIQPEQDVVVRTDLATSVCVQGAPGTGKTAVGLHRAAWLLYAHRDRLRRSGVLVVGSQPGVLVLHRPGSFPPSGRSRSARPRWTSWSAHAVPIRAVDPRRPSRRSRATRRMAEVLERAVWSPLRPATGDARRDDRVPAVARTGRTSPATPYMRCDKRGLRYARRGGGGGPALPQRLSPTRSSSLMEREGRGDGTTAVQDQGRPGRRP